MQRNFMEKRRRRPSYLMPLLFFVLEMVLMWLSVSLLNWDTNMKEWNVYTYPIPVIWIIFSITKFFSVLRRQKVHHE